MTEEEKLVRDCLVRSVAEFSANAMSARAMHRFAADAPELFVSVSLDILLTAEETAGYRYLAMLLIRHPAMFKQLADPKVFTREQAVLLARYLMTVEPSLDVRIAHQLPPRYGVRPGVLLGQHAERALEIIDEISSGGRAVPLLMHLVNDQDHRISSKAALLVGRRVRNVALARRLLAEGCDRRVRANVVEGAWGNDAPAIQELFLNCMEDPDNRVVGNAIMGLHLAGKPGVPDILKRLSMDGRPEFRMTAAWTMGRIDYANSIQDLSQLIKDGNPRVRGAAFRSIQNIRKREKMRAPAEAASECEAPAPLSEPVEAPAEE